jgi:hypothetical protein
MLGVHLEVSGIFLPSTSVVSVCEHHRNRIKVFARLLFSSFPSTASKEFLQGTIYLNRAWAFVLDKYTHLIAPANLNHWTDVSPIISVQTLSIL